MATPKLPEAYTAVRFLKELAAHYGQEPGRYQAALDDAYAFIAGCAACDEEARLRDMPRPNYGRFAPSPEGTPEYEFSLVQRESSTLTD